MSATRHDEPAPHVSSQVAASALHAQRFAREESAKKIFGEIKTACNEAKQEYRRVRDFALDPNTSGPRGTCSTQHGEIAERLTVADTNVTAILDGRRPTATYDVARKGPVDIIVDNIPIQSKYGKSTYLSLREIIQHLEEKGSDSLLLFQIPREQRNQLDELRDSGTIEGLRPRDIDAIRSKLVRIEELDGRSTQDIIRPGTGTYDEVQLDRLGDTINDRERKIETERDRRNEQVLTDHAPSVAELAQAAAFGGVMGAGVGIVHAMFVKCQAGKNPFSNSR